MASERSMKPCSDTPSRQIYKSGTLCPVVTQRCDTITPASLATFYNLEMVVALAFRLNTYEASRIRQKVLESLTQRKMEVLHLLFAQKSGGNDNFCHIEQIISNEFAIIIIK